MRMARRSVPPTAPGVPSPPPRSAADSRDYVFAFPISSWSDLPPDFPPLSGPEPLLAGVFVPADRPGWLPRRSFPARVLLLTARELIVAAHPSASEPLLRLPLHLLRSVESGRILLLGWTSLVWDGGRKHLPFNAANRRYVDRFIAALFDLWLPAPRLPRSTFFQHYGEPSTLKFENAGQDNLVTGELPLAGFFQPPLRRAWRWGPFRSESWLPGDLLTVTSRRLLWIEDRWKGRYEPYGAVAHSAPLPPAADLPPPAGSLPEEIAIPLPHGELWRIPLRRESASEGRRFLEALRRILLETER